jgi:hypothetical protein
MKLIAPDPDMRVAIPYEHQFERLVEELTKAWSRRWKTLSEEEGYLGRPSTMTGALRLTPI